MIRLSTLFNRFSMISILEETLEPPMIAVNEIPDGWEGLDIGPKTIALYAEVIKNSKTILWNGPTGVFEFENFTDGSRAVGEAIVEATKNGAFSLVGGGDSVACVNKFGLASGISDYTIREATFEDATLIFEAIDKNREDLRIWLPFVDGLKSVADEQGFLQSVLAVPYEQRDPVYILEQGEAICGLAGFHFSDAPNRRTEIGYWLLPAYRGKGIVTNTVRYLCQWAVRERNMNRIQIRCAVGNIPSNAVPKRLGFTLEGTEREGELLTSGEYVNVNVYSILKKEIEQWNRKSN
jgi:RimJ/RimL family protein N-acetyltransferase